MRGYPVQGCQGPAPKTASGHVKGELWPAATRAGRHVWHEAPKTGRAFTAEINGSPHLSGACADFMLLVSALG